MVANYPHALEFVSTCHKTQKMCDKAVDTYPFTIIFLPECFMSQVVIKQLIDVSSYVVVILINPEMCHKVVSKDLSWTVYCPDKYMLKECVLKLLMIL